MRRKRTLGHWTAGLSLVGFLALTPGCGSGTNGNDGGTAQTVAPAITTQPSPTQTVTAGTSVSFVVVATGTPTPTYQWKKDGVAIANSTSATFTIAAPVVGDSGTYTVTATNSVNSVTSNGSILIVNPAPPSGLVYSSNPANYTRNLAITPNTPSNSGGVASAYSVSPDLPSGLSLNITTGVISGTPTALTASAAYTITASNMSGNTPAVLTIAVNDAAPTALTYTTATATYTKNVAITSNVPSNSGGTVTAYSVSPSLPAGLSLDTTTGIISGTPTVESASTTYTVTASNSGGIAQAVITIAVDPSHSSVSITTQPLTQVMTAPDSPTFTVVATGDSLTYQWKKNGSAITLATSASYTVPGFTDLQTVPDSYTVVVTSGSTSVESDSATFSVVAPNPFYLPGGKPTAPPSRPIHLPEPLYVDAQKFPAGAFVFGYDEALKNAAWTAYGNFKVNTTYANGGGDYKTDTNLDPPQVTKDDMGTHGGAGFYLSNGQGFDRGHMVMRSDVSYRYGPAAGDWATYMGNLVPQVSYFNQRLWLTLEGAVGGDGSPFNNGLTAIFGRVWVYTGPVFTGTVNYWVPSTETYTTNRAGVPAGTLAIAIPTACYKIMVAEPAQGQTLPRVMAWVSSNRSYATSENADVWKYVTSVKRIEDLTGLDFLPNLTHDAALTTLKSSVDVRGWGTDFEKATGPNVHMIQPSWDIIPIVGNPVLTGENVNTGATVTFEAAVTPNNSGGTVDPATGCTWTFGDSTTATGLSTTHVYGTTGSYNVTFTATDNLGHSNAITRVINVVGVSANTPPTFTPSTLPNVPATVGQAIPNVTFALTDDTTTPGNLVVTAASGNQTLLPDAGIVPVNTNGNVSVSLTPQASQTGTALVTVTAADSDGASTQKTFTLTVNANNPPTFTPTTLADVSTAQDSTKQVTFTLTDDLTDPAALDIVVTSNNQTLLPNGTTTIANVAGAVTLTLHPASGQNGTTVVTVVATDGNGAATTKAFTLTVNSVSAAPILIISQYYEGTATNKWIEITNVGNAEWVATDTPMSLWLWSNPFGTNTYQGAALTGTLAVGSSRLYMNSATVLPLAANVTGTGTPLVTASTPSNAIINFNGDDVVFLSPTAAVLSGSTVTNGAAAFAARTDVIGINDTALWMGNNGTSAGTAYANVLGMNRSYVRKPSFKANTAFLISEWTQVDALEIKTTAYSAVDTAAVDSTNRLGYHVYIP